MFLNSLLCKAPEICDEGFLPTRNLQGTRTEEGEPSDNYDYWGNARVLEESMWGAPKGERGSFLESQSSGQDEMRREVITELGASDWHAREGACCCGWNRRRKSRV